MLRETARDVCFGDSVVVWMSSARVAHALVDMYELLVASTLRQEEPRDCLTWRYFVSDPIVSSLVVSLGPTLLMGYCPSRLSRHSHRCPACISLVMSSSCLKRSHKCSPSWVHGSFCRCPHCCSTVARARWSTSSAQVHT